MVVGLVAGALFISASQKWLKGAGEIEFADMKGADARKMLLMVRSVTSAESCTLAFASATPDHLWANFPRRRSGS